MLRFSSNGGLSTHCFRWIFQYTTSSATNPSSSSFAVVDYLVQSLGFSQQEAIATSSKVSRFKSSQNPDSVISFLKEIGLAKTHIKSIVYNVPKILSCKVDKTLKPKIKALQDLGLSGSHLARVVCKNPDIWKTSSNSLIPTLQYLKTILKTDELLFRVLGQCYSLLNPTKMKNLPSHVGLLQDYGFSAAQIQQLLLARSRIFQMSLSRVQANLVRVEEILRIPRNSPSFFKGFCVLVCLSGKTIEYKIEVYKSCGFTELDVWTFARKMPYNLALSESKIRSGLKFFMEDLGCDIACILRHPALLTFSLEKRVIPRHTVLQVLKEKRLIKTDYTIRYWLYLTESQFLNMFVLPFMDVVPDLCENYIRTVGCSIDSQTAKLKVAESG